MMTGSVTGKTLSEARDMFERFHQMVTGNADPLANSERLDKLAVFANASASSWHRRADG